MMRALDGRAIRRFRTPITVRRKGTGTYVNGRYVPSGTETVLTINDAVVQPLSPKELQLLPEGFRTKAAIKVYSRELLRTADAEAGHEADRIDYQAEVYEVHAVEDWDAHGGYRKAVAIQEGQ
jgi:hypothetical protein